ncbi:MAG: hypothetical protein J5I93_04565 [Pirellulaceae bacterium]|nr:hypothetical protein [Pirellulaceae bacterium]
MSDHHVEEHLRRAERAWRGRLLVRRVSIIAVAGLLAVLAVGGVMYGGLFSTALAPGLLLVFIGTAALLSVCVVLVVTVDQRLDKRLLASALERSSEPLQDRLHALVYLESREDLAARQLRPWIERQASDVLQAAPTSGTFPRLGVRRHLAATLVALLLTVGFFAWFQPWKSLGKLAPPGEVVQGDEDLELPPLTETSTEDSLDALNQEPWTDVRISEPGKDLRVTQHEVVPLRIEAASNRGLKKVEWLMSINGGDPLIRPLPAPEDPRYAAYDTQLLLEDQGLQPWDVVGYFARATTSDGAVHESQLYFLQLIPYGEQLDELPGGERGEALREFANVTELVERQQEVIRQTQQLAEPGAGQSPAGGKQPPASGQQPQAGAKPADKATRSRLETLAEDEARLGRDIQLFDAALGGMLDDQQLHDFQQASRQSLERLAAAERELREGDAGGALRAERQALASLVELRQQLQQLVERHPEAFQPDPLQQLAEHDLGSADAEQGQPLSLDELLEQAPPEQRAALRELFENHQLEQRLRQNAEQYAGIQQQPETATQEQVSQAVEETREIAREHPRELDSDQRRQLGAKCDQLGQASAAPQRQALAGDMRQQLEQLADQLAQQRSERIDQMQAEEQANQMQRMQARRDELGAARQFLQDTLERQRNLQRAIPDQPQSPLQDQARQQLELQQALEDFARQNPDPFQQATEQRQACSSAMRHATQSMQQGSPDSKQRTEQAADALQKLDSALGQQQQRNELADAMRMQRSLEQQIERLQRFEQQPQSASASQCRNAGGQAQAAAGQLQQMAQAASADSPLGSQLKQQMEGGAKQRVDEAAEQLSRAETPGDKGQAARQLREQLQPLADLLQQQTGQQPGQQSGQQPGMQPGQQPGQQPGDAPQPGSSSQPGSQRSLRSEGWQAMEHGLRQLDSLARRQQLGRSSPDSRQPLSREALRSFSEAISGLYGHNERSEAVLARMRDQLQEQATPVDQATLQELVQQMQLLRREAPAEQPQVPRTGSLLGNDPDRIAPEYRDWARKYFEQLSRQPAAP